MVYWRHHDHLFLDAFNQAEEDACDVIRKEIYRRAVEGVRHERPIFQRGIQVGVEVTTRYSDPLLELEAKRRMKDYRDIQRHEHTGQDGAPLVIEIVPGVPSSSPPLGNVVAQGAQPPSTPHPTQPALPAPAPAREDDDDDDQLLADDDSPVPILDANERPQIQDTDPDGSTGTLPTPTPGSKAHLINAHTPPPARTADDPDPPTEAAP